MELAELMDQTLINGKLPTNAYDPLVIKKLSAFETGFHEACAEKIYDLYYERILVFLYNFLQSEAFVHGERIASAKTTEDDATVWPPPPQPSKKLNIVNRADFEFIEPEQQ